ncbi:MAG: sigma-70 region 4 domain-containing protein [Candidatus Thiodiazotropha endolucinida]|nr:sigma-70 region 4 domain-containing protein [Candidatus Thiodiazotropha endolucinida]
MKRRKRDYPEWMLEKKTVQFLYDQSKRDGVKASPITDENLEEIKKACKEILSWDYSYDRRRFKAIRKRSIDNNPQHKESLEKSLDKEQPDYGGAHQINKGIDETICIALAELRVLLENQDTTSKVDLNVYDTIAGNLLQQVSAQVSASVVVANEAKTKFAGRNRSQSADKRHKAEIAIKMWPGVLAKYEGKKSQAYSEIAEILGVSDRTVRNYLKK